LHVRTLYRVPRFAGTFYHIRVEFANHRTSLSGYLRPGTGEITGQVDKPPLFDYNDDKDDVEFGDKERRAMAIKIVPISDLRRKTSDVIQALQESGDPVYITQHGRPVVVLVEYARYERMLRESQ